jgi:hypothetical protein
MFGIEQCGYFAYFEFVPADFETRIRELCERAVSTTDPEQLHAVFDELRTALREHLELVRDLSRTSLASIEHEARRHKNAA